VGVDPAGIERAWRSLRSRRAQTPNSNFQTPTSKLQTPTSKLQALDWTLWFLILVCAAMFVEGLLDYHLTRTAGPHFTEECHVDEAGDHLRDAHAGGA
jgi:hypothetical protein